jgi:hypothetical protein
MSTRPTRSRPSTIAAVGLALAVLTAPLVLVTGPASAAQLTVTDPAGDTLSLGLDLTGATLNNADYRLATTVNVTSVRAGVVVVGLKARDQSLVRLVSRRWADGSSRSFAIDAHGSRIHCRGLSVGWRDEAASVTFDVPSRCLWGGSYGEVKAWYLTESARDGEDSDYLPAKRGSIVFSDWVARG